jgi:hypothetical protein
MLSFVLPVSILTSPLGLVRSLSKLHGISKGTIEPRGKGMVILALGVYVAAVVAVCIFFGLCIAAFQIALIEDHKYFDVLYSNVMLHLPLQVGLRNPSLTVGFPFAVVMIGGFIVQRRYGVVRSLLGCTGVLLFLITSSPVDYDDGIPTATENIVLQLCALQAIVTALWMPQKIEVKTIDRVVK